MNFSNLIAGLPVSPYFHTEDFALLQADALELLREFPENSVDMIFADPPYFLSNNGTTCYAGKRVSVNKGSWDKSKGQEADLEFHRTWISECKRILKPEGTIWISGTLHNIYQTGFLLQSLGFHILNDIVWYKPNAAPNLACRTFAHSHETLLWAKKDKKAKHFFNYKQMKEGDFPKDFLKNPGKQMRSVWAISTPSSKEKTEGKHPTQKPLALLERILLASTKEGSIILDPFNGSGTTGIAARKLGKRYYVGIDTEMEFLELTVRRYEKVRRVQGLFK